MSIRHVADLDPKLVALISKVVDDRLDDLLRKGAELQDRLLYKSEIIEVTGLSYVSVWSLMRKGAFPRSRIVGGQSAWLQSEVTSWLRGLPKRKLKGDLEPPAERVPRAKRGAK